MTTAGLVALGLVVIGALAVIIVFIWVMDARRNEHVAHDEERVEQPPEAQQKHQPGDGSARRVPKG